MTSLVNLTEESFTEYLERSFCYFNYFFLTFGEPTSILRLKEYMKLTADDYSFNGTGARSSK